MRAVPSLLPMKLFTYHSYGDNSDEVTTSIDSITQNDTTNPLVVVPSLIDWSTWYAGDGALLDGSPNDAFPNGRPSLLYYQWVGVDPKQYLEVFINGNTTLAKGIPFRFCANAHGAAKLTRCVPRLGGVLTDCSIVFQQANGTQPIVLRYQQNII